MTDKLSCLLEDENFNEAIYLDEFLKTANLEQIFKKKQEIQQQLDDAIENRNKLLNELELTIVNGILNINQISNDAKKIENKGKNISAEFQQLWTIDKPILANLNNFTNEFKFFKSEAALKCIEDSPNLIKLALDTDNVTKALVIYSNILSSSSKPEIKKIIPSILPLFSELEKKTTNLIMNGSFLPLDSIYQRLQMANFDKHTSLTLALMNSINHLDNLLEIIKNSEDHSFISNSNIFLDKLAFTKNFIYTISSELDSFLEGEKICIKCILSTKKLSEKICKNGKLSAFFCFKCYISPLIYILIYKLEGNFNNLIDKIKLLNLEEFNYCLVTEAIKTLKLNLNSEFDLILKTILSNFDSFFNEINEDLFNSVFKSIKKGIDTIFTLYTKTINYINIDIKPIFFNVCSCFLSKLIKIFSHAAILYSLFNDIHKVTESLPKIDYSIPLLDNYITFNPLINVKGNVKHISCNRFYMLDDKIILDNNNEALKASLRLILFLRNIFISKIIDYANSTFLYFEENPKDVNLYTKFGINFDCPKCSEFHSLKNILFENPREVVNEALKFILSQLIINTSISMTTEIGKKIVSISPLIIYEDDSIEVHEAVSIFKNKLVKMLDLLQIIPKSASSYSFDNFITSNNMYINIDPLINDQYGLIHYYIYLIIMQLIEYLRFEYINSPSLLNSIFLKLSRSCFEVLKARGITYPKYINNLCNTFGGINKN